MKTLTIISYIIFASLFSVSFQNTKDYSLARVTRTNGKYVFIGCEPVNDYDVVFDFKWTITTGSLSEYQGNPITAADKVAKKKELTYDAIIIGDAKKDIAIKFR